MCVCVSVYVLYLSLFFVSLLFILGCLVGGFCLLLVFFWGGGGVGGGGYYFVVFFISHLLN